MTPVKQISVFVENKHGKLSTVTRILADNGISIRALCMADTTDFGIFRLIVSDYVKAENALKAEGITCSVTRSYEMGCQLGKRLMRMIENKDCDDKGYSYVMKPVIHEGTSIREL